MTKLSPEEAEEAIIKAQETLERLISEYPEASEMVRMREDARRNYNSHLHAAHEEGWAIGFVQSFSESMREELARDSHLNSSAIDKKILAALLNNPRVMLHCPLITLAEATNLPLETVRAEIKK